MENLPSFRDDLYFDIKPDYSDSLAHHGIKGMHWGIRRYQNPDGSLTNAGRIRQNSNRNRLKTAAKVAGAAAAVGLAGAGVYVVSKKDGESAFVNNEDYDPETGFLKKHSNLDNGELDSAMKTNPNAFYGDAQYLTNCTHCSVAYDLRRRGFNVEAGPGHVHLEGFIQKAYKNPEQHDIPGIDLDGIPAAKSLKLSLKTVRNNMKVWKNVQKKAIDDPQGFSNDQSKMLDSIIKQCEDMGPGARGSISLVLATGMAHNIAFECDKDGNVGFVDSQLISTFSALSMDGAYGGKSSNYVNGFLKRNVMPYCPASVTRYDNAEPNYDFLKKKHIVVPSGS